MLRNIIFIFYLFVHEQTRSP